jgi:putative acetyltransferase
LRAYAAALPFSLDFQGFEAELAGLPGPYSPPGGCLLLARSAGAAHGMIALKPLACGVAAIKQLYVVRAARRLGLGRRLLDAALAAALAADYACVRLDSHQTSMAAAIALYRRLGFVAIPPYGPDLDGAIVFFEKQLRD